jgi:hypothetical protein
LRPRISLRGHRRPMIKKEAEVNLAHNRRKGVRSRAVPFASRAAEPASHGRRRVSRLSANAGSAENRNAEHR